MTDSTVVRHRLSSLLDARVVDGGGEFRGWVREIRLCGQSGEGRVPEHPYVHGFFVTRKGFGSMLGFGHDYQQGPWLIAVLMRRRHRDDHYVPWEQVAELDWDTPVTVRLKQSRGSG